MKVTAGSAGGVKIWTVWAVAALTAAGIGAGLGGTDTLDLVGERTVMASLDAAPYHACPDAAAIGAFHRGDRVLTTGRDSSGGWFEVRAPSNLSARVWVEASYVVPDASVDSLPIHDCELVDGTPTPPAVATSTTATAIPGTTTRSRGAATTTTTTAEEPTTTAAPDTVKPKVGGVVAEPDEIFESGCPNSESSVSVTVVDDHDPAPSVTLAWEAGSVSGSATMSQSGTTYTASVGPFPAGTVGPDNPDGFVPVVLTVTARDASGNTRVVGDIDNQLTLWEC